MTQLAWAELKSTLLLSYHVCVFLEFSSAVSLGCETRTAFLTTSRGISARRTLKQNTSVKLSGRPTRSSLCRRLRILRICQATRKMKCWRWPRLNRTTVSEKNLRICCDCASNGNCLLVCFRGLLHWAWWHKRWGGIDWPFVARRSLVKKSWGQVWLQDQEVWCD